MYIYCSLCILKVISIPGKEYYIYVSFVYVYMLYMD